jgi:hypothetical protein
MAMKRWSASSSHSQSPEISTKSSHGGQLARAAGAEPGRGRLAGGQAADQQPGQEPAARQQQARHREGAAATDDFGGHRGRREDAAACQQQGQGAHGEAGRGRSGRKHRAILSAMNGVYDVMNGPHSCGFTRMQADYLAPERLPAAFRKNFQDV